MQKKQATRTGFSVESIGNGEYAGFELDGDGRFLLGDFTVTHNTLCACYLMHEMGFPANVFLVHREELAHQAIKAISRSFPDLSVGLVKAESNQIHADVVVASVPTLARQARLDQLDGALPSKRMVIADESHHAPSDTWTKVIHGIDPDFLVGLSATAYRADKRALGDLFQEVVYHLGMLPLIAQGRLADLIGLRVDTGGDLDEVHTVAGEFNEKELADAVDTPERNEIVITEWIKQASKEPRRKRTVAFAVNIQHAEHLRDLARGYGLSAELVVGTTPSEERQHIYDDFHDGRIHLLTNVMVLSEGWDEPAADCGLMTRPTKSLGLYAQQVGRLARSYPGKQNALIIDYVDNTSRHKLISLPVLAGHEAEGDDEAEDVAHEQDQRDDGEALSLFDMAQTVTKVRHLRSVTVDLFGASPYLWREAAGRWMTTIGRGGYLALLTEGDGYVPIQIVQPKADGAYPPPGPEIERLFDRPVDLATARTLAEARVPQTALTDREAAWRRGQPSPAQLAYAERLRLKVPRGASCGDVSTLIDEKRFEIMMRRI